MPVQAALQFSEAQQEDLMLLRRLFYGKLGVLSRSRKDCLKRMPFGAATTAAEINGRLAEVAAWFGSACRHVWSASLMLWQICLQLNLTWAKSIYAHLTGLSAAQTCLQMGAVSAPAAATDLGAFRTCHRHDLRVYCCCG